MGLQSGLVTKLMAKLMAKNSFYTLKYLDGRVSDMDIRLADDVNEFTETASKIWSRLIMPLLKVIWFARSAPIRSPVPLTSAACVGIPHDPQMAAQLGPSEIGRPRLLRIIL